MAPKDVQEESKLHHGCKLKHPLEAHTCTLKLAYLAKPAALLNLLFDTHAFKDPPCDFMHPSSKSNMHKQKVSKCLMTSLIDVLVQRYQEHKKECDHVRPS